MRRRQLLQLGSLGAALGVAGPWACCPPARSRPDPASGDQEQPAPPSSDAPFALAEQSIEALQAMMASGRESARSIVEQYLVRIEALDGQGPTLGAVIEINADALRVAQGLDAERARGALRGPLHGIPILLKDNIATGDGMHTTAGSLALASCRSRQDAHVAARLRRAGAVLLGKANMSEWANFRSTRSTSGWSSVRGQCRNPYALDRSPCGSSSGSAAATAANLCAAAVGTETDGSIICPAAACGIVGLKPTVGLVSRTGIVPISHRQDTAGPMARTVTDAALMLSAMAGVDASDPPTATPPEPRTTDFAAALRPDAMNGVRLGVARSLFGFHEGVDAVMDRSLDQMRGLGATLIDPIDLALPRQIHKLELELMLVEFKAGLEAYLRWLGPAAPFESLDELIAFNEQHRGEVMPYFGQELLLQARDKGSPDDAYRESVTKLGQAVREQGIDRVCREHRLDAIIGPSNGPAWPIDVINGDHFLGGSSAFAAMAGYPHITIPAGHIHDLPVGVSLFGPAWSEPRLLALGFAFEQASPHRRPPAFSPRTPRRVG